MTICVTGKMASGKNYICSKFEKDGWKSIDADLLVHDAIKNQSQKIYDTFKDYAKEKNINLLENNPTELTINRKSLGQLLFSNPELLKKQEEIVYPEITKIIKNIIQKNDKTIINATVLYKTPELLQMCEKIYFVKAPFLTRLIRAKKRDNLPIVQILKRFYSQKNLLKEYKKFSVPITIIKNK